MKLQKYTSLCASAVFGEQQLNVGYGIDVREPKIFLNETRS